MAPFPLKALFEKSIFRDIKGVVKVGQHSEELRFQEVDEYVVTHELRRHMAQFYSHYGSSIDTPTDKNGVWISGFFGSGKSHFLKILSYLIGNATITDQTTDETTRVVDAFKPKVDDSLFLADMKRAADIPTDVILFNIDSKADSDSKNDKEAIVKVFLRVFNEYLGYSTKSFQIAEMERYLDRNGKLDNFKQTFEAECGQPWEEARDDVNFLVDELVMSLSRTLGMSEEAAGPHCIAPFTENLLSQTRLLTF